MELTLRQNDSGWVAKEDSATASLLLLLLLYKKLMKRTMADGPWVRIKQVTMAQTITVT